jgi:DNA-binding NarL/FixJ family response regulator
VGRHQYLSDHFGLFFRDFGLETVCAVGIEGAIEAARRDCPDVVICDYELLATAPLGDWERDEVLSRTPVVAVSLTRRPCEGHLLDVNGIAGFLYLPALTKDEALTALAGACRRQTYVLNSSFDKPRATTRP